jgi:hypothetical protein
MLTVSETKDNPGIKGLYIMAFTSEELEPEKLNIVTHVADNMLRAKNPTFKALMEERMAPKTRIEIANLKHVPIMHTPQTMQTTMMGWLKRQYGVAFKPVIEKNFFPHGMRDPQGRENYFLFYFDIAA